MKVTIIGRQMNVWDEMKATIEAKLEKLDKYFGDDCDHDQRIRNHLQK